MTTDALSLDRSTTLPRRGAGPAFAVCKAESR